MATTTPNYGWTVPTSTDLVKDGATAIETLGDAVDATVYANANAAIAKSIVDAKGDLIAATAADTVSRLAVGSNDQVLTADSTTATGLKWAAVAGGGQTLIASGTVTSGTSVSLTSIPQTYNSLILEVFGLTRSGGFNSKMRVSQNNYTTGGIAIVEIDSVAGTVGTQSNQDYYSIPLQGNINLTQATNYFNVRFNNYTNSTSYQKDVVYNYGAYTSNTQTGTGSAWHYNDSAAITSLKWDISGLTIATGSYRLWGVK